MWMKIVWAVGLVLMILYLWPTARHLIRHGPKGSRADWQAALLPILLVVVFVVLLILSVRG